jgi:hypothetical protein
MSIGRQIPLGSGWLPHPDKFRQWAKEQLKSVDRGRVDFETLHPVIKKFKKLIEETPAISMGFKRMFFQTMQNYDLRGEGQVRRFLTNARYLSLIVK